MDCIFCKIANKEIPCKFLYEDEEILAFDDIKPQAPIHKLIIPRQHIATINDIDENNAQLTGKLMYTAQQLAKQLGISEEGYRVVMNCNKNGGQDVFHIHLHLLGGRRMSWPPG
jgi:histidine triad (HIT) family protein